MMEIILPVLTLSILGFIFGIALGIANKVFFVQTDAKVGRILSALPGANCGVCGFAGCEMLAEALAEGKAAPETCVPGGHEAHQKVAEILGVEAKAAVKKTATLTCNGGKCAKDKFEYHGPQDCIVANMYQAGQKSCTFGCLGFGTCAVVCPFNAIKMNKDNLPEIDPNLCTACGKCVVICPKHVLELRPTKSHIWVDCSSTDKGAVVMKACGKGCIGCNKCAAVCKFDAIHIKDNLAKIDYFKCTNCRLCVDVCPTKVILTDYKMIRG